MTTSNNTDGQPEMLYDRTDFPSAEAKYRALVEEWQKDNALQERLSDYTGTYALSFIEAEIFAIDPALTPALYWAYERYENLIGSMDAYFGEFREQERSEYARYFKGECVNSMPDAVDFMVEACGLPALQCFGWVLKIKAAELRSGLIESRKLKEK